MKPQTVLIATWREGLFALSGDGLSEEIQSLPVRGLVPDGRRGALAIVDGHSLCRRIADGRWTPVATSDCELSCCLAVGSAVYVGTDDARMLRLSEQSGRLEVIDAFHSVVGRDAWYAGSAMVDGQRLGPPLGIRSLAANADGSTLFANVHVGGIPRTLDGGLSWQPTIDINSDVHEVCADRTDPNLIVAAAAVGLCISRDCGRTWTIESEGLHDSHCYAVAISGEDILFSAAQDPFAAPGKVYRKPLRSHGPIEAVTGGMPSWTEGMVDTACIAASGPSVAFADRRGNLYRSHDFGRTWSREAIGLAAPSSLLIC